MRATSKSVTTLERSNVHLQLWVISVAVAPAEQMSAGALKERIEAFHRSTITKEGSKMQTTLRCCSRLHTAHRAQTFSPTSLGSIVAWSFIGDQRSKARLGLITRAHDLGIHSYLQICAVPKEVGTTWERMSIGVINRRVGGCPQIPVKFCQTWRQNQTPMGD